MNYNPSPLRQKHKPIRDKAHLAFLHTLPCCVLGYEGEGIQAHHLRHVPSNEAGAAVKSGDNWCVPLWWSRHNDLHAGGISEYDWFAHYGIYAPGLAAVLWVLTGNEDACRRAIQEARGG